MNNQDNVISDVDCEPEVQNDVRKQRRVILAIVTVLLSMAVITIVIGIFLYNRNQCCYEEITFNSSFQGRYEESIERGFKGDSADFRAISGLWKVLLDNSTERFINIRQEDDGFSVIGSLSASHKATDSTLIKGRFISSTTIRLEEHKNGIISGAYRGTLINDRIVGSYIDYSTSEEQAFDMEQYVEDVSPLSNDVSEMNRNDRQNYVNDGAEDDMTIPYKLVEVKPTFDGGDANHFSAWVNKHLVYPKEEVEKGIQGSVVLQFTIDQNGRLGNVKVLRGVSPALDKEAVRVVSMSPLWKPGLRNGTPVNVTYTFPVRFQLR